MGESETEQLEVRNKEGKRSGQKKEKKKRKGRRNKRQTNGTVRNQVSKGNGNPFCQRNLRKEA